MASDAYRQTSCVVKIRYALATEAAAAMRHMQRRKGKRRADKCEVYSCEFCGGFHFGHPMSKVRNGTERD